MRTCHFCGKWYRNKQAVRAHLQWCSQYIAEKGGEREGQEKTRGYHCNICGRNHEVKPYKCGCGLLAV